MVRRPCTHRASQCAQACAPTWRKNFAPETDFVHDRGQAPVFRNDPSRGTTLRLWRARKSRFAKGLQRLDAARAREVLRGGKFARAVGSALALRVTLPRRPPPGLARGLPSERGTKNGKIVSVFLFGVGLAGASLCALLLWVYRHQEALIFHPDPLPQGYVYDLPEVTEITVAVDGAELSALHLRLPAAKGIVFYLHGNAGNLASWFADTSVYRHTNFDLFMLDYRGYGKSTGRIRSEEQLHCDAAAAWRRISAQYEGRRKVIVGCSLGSALAARLAVQVRPDLTVLISPYWSMTELARLHFFSWMPVRFMRYRLETFRDVARIDGPVLLMHGERDALIPVTHSVQLQALARSAQLIRIAGAAHNDVEDFAEYRRGFSERLAAL